MRFFWHLALILLTTLGTGVLLNWGLMLTNAPSDLRWCVGIAVCILAIYLWLQGVIFTLRHYLKLGGKVADKQSSS